MNTRMNVDTTGNRFCGPLVLAALLGISTGEAAAEVRKANPHKTMVKGTCSRELARALYHHGFLMEQIPVQKDERTVRMFGRPQRMLVGPTMAQWLKSDGRVMDAPYIVQVSNHWVLVKGRKTVDTFTKGEWVFLSKCPHRRKRVVKVYKVVRS